MVNSIAQLPSLLPHIPALENLSPRDRELFCAYGMGPSRQPTAPTISSALSQIFRDFPEQLAATTVDHKGRLNVSSNMTYAQLDHHSDRLAALLRFHGVSNNDAVCIFLTRSIPMLVAIVATLKVGACYVPQHVGVAPSEQLLRVATATKTRVVLTLEKLVTRLPRFDDFVSVVAVDSFMTESTTVVSAFNGPERPVRASDRCYIIFTSGTTGKPKGVQVTHGNVANIILTHPMDLGLSPGKRIAQILSISFDMGAWEILGSLTHGSTLLIRNRDISAAVKHADVIIATPTVLGSIDASQMQHIQTVAVAGEPCPRSLAETWGKFCTFYNSCGPTEVTIVNTAKMFDPRESILTIGSPTPNNTVYVLNPDTRAPCKIGEVGEMWGGGLCVSEGYLNNAELTTERYLLDPFMQPACGKKWRMYKTGDLGRWNNRGELEHFGRVDDQVKVKGFRVELDGISSVIERTPGVQKAVVLKVDDELVAWVTPKMANIQSTIATVGKHLPYYCVPSQVIGIDDLPKTSNGKTDKRLLSNSISTQSTLRLTPSVSEHMIEMKSKLPHEHLWYTPVCKVSGRNRSCPNHCRG